MVAQRRPVSVSAWLTKCVGGFRACLKNKFDQFDTDRSARPQHSVVSCPTPNHGSAH